MNEHTLMMLNVIDGATEAIYNSGYHDGYEASVERYKPDDFDEDAIRKNERIHIRNALRKKILGSKTDDVLIISCSQISNIIDIACGFIDDDA